LGGGPGGPRAGAAGGPGGPGDCAGGPGGPGGPGGLGDGAPEFKVHGDSLIHVYSKHQASVDKPTWLSRWRTRRTSRWWCNPYKGKESDKTKKKDKEKACIPVEAGGGGGPLGGGPAERAQDGETRHSIVTDPTWR
jgi:hypothetical protein